MQEKRCFFLILGHFGPIKHNKRSAETLHLFFYRLSSFDYFSKVGHIFDSKCLYFLNFFCKPWNGF